jgi:hypothetical protein
MQCAVFLVHKRPQVVWAWDLADRNLEFLRGVDVGYFEHVAMTERDLLLSDRNQYAAAALRVANGQALETLFAFIAALTQAPTCVVGWMLAYQNDELRAVLEDLQRRDLVEISRTVMSATQWDREKQERLAQRFGTLWSRWSREFLDERAQTEYNAFKHGMRAQLGGFSIAIGKEETPGVPAPQESMVGLGSSAIVTAFFTAERVDGRLHLYPRRTNRNWNPEGMAHGLELLAMSIQNVISYLRIINHDDPAACRFETPIDDAAFDLPWQYSPGVTFSSMDLVVAKEHIQTWTKDEVLVRLHDDHGESSPGAEGVDDPR